MGQALTNIQGSPDPKLENVNESLARRLLIHILFPLSQQGFELDDKLGVQSGEIVALARIVV